MKHLLRTLAVGSLLISANSYFSTAHAQGTAFTYQGVLNSGGAPAPTGLYDFRFRLFFDPLGNTQAGGTVLDNAVPATNGLFLATVDFGSGIFNGTNYWLEIDVRTNNAATYTDLSPLQEVTPTPYAVFANTSSNLSGTLSTANFSGTYGNAVNLNNAGNSFSGTFVGNGSTVSNVNAVALNGLNATNFWQTGGNTNTTAGLNYLGTADNQPLELHVDGQRALRLEPAPTGGAPNVIGGSPNNFVASGTVGATIGGGGATNYASTSYTNSIAADFGTIGGGQGNTIVSGDTASVIVGGVNNLNDVDSLDAFLGGGQNNTNRGEFNVLVGGQRNLNQESYGIVVGGANNLNFNDGNFSIIVGGDSNTNYDGVIVGGVDNEILDHNGQAFLGAGRFNAIATGDTANIGNSVLVGGAGNTIRGIGNAQFIGGGLDNTINAPEYAVLVGGNSNTNSASFATIGGGVANLISTTLALDATIPGGASNVVSGEYGFAAGQQAQALHTGAFVWADSQNATFSSTNSDSFNVRSQGGARFVTSGAGLSVDGPVNTTELTTMRVGSIGTTITNMQAGQVTLPNPGLGAGVVETNYTITFPLAFSSSPKISVSIANDPNFQGVSDVYTVCVSSNSAAAFMVNVLRLDANKGSGWSQNLRLNWLAWQ